MDDVLDYDKVMDSLDHFMDWLAVQYISALDTSTTCTTSTATKLRSWRCTIVMSIALWHARHRGPVGGDGLPVCHQICPRETNP
ncbi:hypothetical protein ACLK14_17495 [Escherichia coli]